MCGGVAGCVRLCARMVRLRVRAQVHACRVARRRAHHRARRVLARTNHHTRPCRCAARFRATGGMAPARPRRGRGGGVAHTSTMASRVVETTPDHYGATTPTSRPQRTHTPIRQVTTLATTRPTGGTHDQLVPSPLVARVSDRWARSAARHWQFDSHTARRPAPADRAGEAQLRRALGCVCADGSESSPPIGHDQGQGAGHGRRQGQGHGRGQGQ